MDDFIRSGDIARGENVRLTRLLRRACRGATIFDADIRSIERQSAGIRRASERLQNSRRLGDHSLPVVLENDALLSVGIFSTDQPRAREHAHTAVAQPVRERCGEIGIGALQKLAATLDQRHFASEA